MLRKIVSSAKKLYGSINLCDFYFREFGYKNLFQSIIARHSKKTVLLEIKRDDCKYKFYLRCPGTDVSIYSQIFVHFEYDCKIASEPKVIIDAGANIGLASIYFANKYPKTRIIAVEPEKGNFELLVKNTGPYENIYPVNAALWNVCGEIEVLDSGWGECGYVVDAPPSNENRTEDMSSSAVKIMNKIASITIEKIMHDYQIDEIDILKMDIESAEKEVFATSGNWIDRVKSIVVELHDFMKPGCARSFYNATNTFDKEWRQGENIYISKNNYLMPKQRQT